MILLYNRFFLTLGISDTKLLRKSKQPRKNSLMANSYPWTIMTKYLCTLDRKCLWRTESIDNCFTRDWIRMQYILHLSFSLSQLLLITYDILKSGWDFQGGPVVKNLSANTSDTGLSPGLGRSPGEGNGHPLEYLVPGKSHGQRSLAGYSPWAHKELDMTEWLNQQERGVRPEDSNTCGCHLLGAI